MYKRLAANSRGKSQHVAGFKILLLYTLDSRTTSSSTPLLTRVAKLLKGTNGAFIVSAHVFSCVKATLQHSLDHRVQALSEPQEREVDSGVPLRQGYLNFSHWGPMSTM